MLRVGSTTWSWPEAFAFQDWIAAENTASVTYLATQVAVREVVLEDRGHTRFWLVQANKVRSCASMEAVTLSAVWFSIGMKLVRR